MRNFFKELRETYNHTTQDILNVTQIDPKLLMDIEYSKTKITHEVQKALCLNYRLSDSQISTLFNNHIDLSLVPYLDKVTSETCNLYNGTLDTNIVKPSVKHLNLTNTHISNLLNLIDLESLCLDTCKFNIDELKSLDNIKKLTIVGAQLVDVSFINNMRNLENLYLINCTIENKVTLSYHDKLYYIDLQGSIISDDIRETMFNLFRKVA